MDFESILEEILLGRGQGNLKLKPKQKEALQRSRLLPPQGFRPEAKSRGGTLVARAYIKDSTYSSNMQSVC